jgi:hypothetical protein
VLLKDMLFLKENKIKNNICSNALEDVTMGYNGRFFAPLKTNLYIHIICKDDYKQTAKGKIGHRPIEPGL